MMLLLLFFFSSDKELEEQINAPENVRLEGISDDEWSSDNE